MTKNDLKIYETKMAVFARDGYKCQYPGCQIMGIDNLQAAHRIAKSKSNRKYIIMNITFNHKYKKLAVGNGNGKLF